MLSRSSSDASSRPYVYFHRSKSASSVQERKKHPLIGEPIDPETAKLYALIAAHRAMERSSTRTSEDGPHSGSTRAETGFRRSCNARVRNGCEHVRFSPGRGLNKPRLALQPTSVQQSTPSIASSAPQAPTELSHTYVEEYQYQPSALASEFGRIPSENYGAVPSSYRKLRKSRSMLAPRKSTSIRDLGLRVKSMSSRTSLRNVNSSASATDRGRFAKAIRRSMSFRRLPNRKAFSASNDFSTEQTYSESAIQMARDQFLRDWEGQKARPDLKLSNYPTVRQGRKMFRRSVRTRAGTDFGNGIKSSNQKTAFQSSESKMRSFSQNFTSRVKHLFRKPSSRTTGFPPQHLEAAKEYFGDFTDSSAVYGHAFDRYHVQEETEAAETNNLHGPASGDPGGYEDEISTSDTVQRAASRESLQSGAKSRVTSWTNSSVTGAGSFRAPAHERNRLSIIKEDGGPHQPSSSAGQHIGAISVFQEPINASGIDSQRIYSALMRRIDQEQAEMERAQRELDDIHRERDQARGPVWNGGITVRTVHSEASLRTVHKAPDEEHREFSLGNPDWHGDAQIQAGSTTSEQSKENLERRRAKTAVQDAQSTFFPFSANGEKPKSHSPFRQVLMQKRREGSRVTEESLRTDMPIEDERTLENGPHFQSVGQGQERNLSSTNQLSLGRAAMLSDDSIYSRTTGGGTNEAYTRRIGSSEDFGWPSRHGREATDSASQSELGMATIIPARVGRYPRASERVYRLLKRQSSSLSAKTSESREWRGWMERELGHVGQVGQQLEPTIPGKRQVMATGGLGHVRERAQIDEDDVEIGSGSNTTVQPLKRFPLIDLKEVARGIAPLPKETPGEKAMVGSQSGLLSRKLSTGNLGKNDENKKLTTRGLRKLSPGSMAKLLSAKASTFFGGGIIGDRKENKTPTPSRASAGNDCISTKIGKPKDGSESPPFSTPGRLIMRNGRSPNGRLRLAQSDLALHQAIPTGQGSHLPMSRSSDSSHTVASTHNGLNQGSLGRGEDDVYVVNSEKTDEASSSSELHLPAKSTPTAEGLEDGANQQVPIGSERLRTLAPGGFGDTQRGHGGYGGLGLVGASSLTADGTTIYQQEAQDSRTSTATLEEVRGIGAKLSSKRMVSDFLKKRRWWRSASIQSTSADEGTSTEMEREMLRQAPASPVAFI